MHENICWKTCRKVSSNFKLLNYMHKDLFINIFSDYIYIFLAVKNEEIHAKQLLRTLTFLEIIVSDCFILWYSCMPYKRSRLWWKQTWTADLPPSPRLGIYIYSINTWKDTTCTDHCTREWVKCSHVHWFSKEVEFSNRIRKDSQHRRIFLIKMKQLSLEFQTHACLL